MDRGVVITLVAAAMASLAGVCFERFLAGGKVSVWARTLHLTTCAVLTSLLQLIVSDEWLMVQERGFFNGFTMMTWGYILLNAGGGLVVGMSIKSTAATTTDVAIGGES